MFSEAELNEFEDLVNYNYSFEIDPLDTIADLKLNKDQTIFLIDYFSELIIKSIDPKLLS